MNVGSDMVPEISCCCFPQKPSISLTCVVLIFFHVIVLQTVKFADATTHIPFWCKADSFIRFLFRNKDPLLYWMQWSSVLPCHNGVRGLSCQSPSTNLASPQLWEWASSLLGLLAQSQMFVDSQSSFVVSCLLSGTRTFKGLGNTQDSAKENRLCILQLVIRKFVEISFGWCDVVGSGSFCILT